ncbi:capsular polysaccharide export protein, LipB/KpsS family [Bacillus sp. FJAT-45350]|uniref:capsular polysaccharide export protein, LipB/KpsS family n=1 Tax=Bacillus sp. FJAT-45350 TaxID=2011014 RepID=UPI000BB96C9A|nr:CDP-glycerol glycerophosphotransferase family protein [Bacillus sp. FJAT-45350]
MKEIYLKHYWLLFIEFIETFKELTHNNIPLALLANFYQYIDENVKKEMHEESFRQKIKQERLKMEEIQPYFENLLEPIKSPLKEKKPGPTLLNFAYLRFPLETFHDEFRPEQTAVLMGRKTKDNSYQGISIYHLVDYEKKNTEEEVLLIRKAKQIFTNNSNHILFSNHFFINKFISQIPTMIRILNSVKNFLTEVPISCVIVGTTEDLISRTLAIVSASKGIPSICMQHGALMGEEAFLPIFTTKVAVYGGYEKQWYLARGAIEEQVEIIGHPRYDTIFKRESMPKKQFQEEFNLDPKKQYILIATQPGSQKKWSQLVKKLIKNTDYEIIIKPHPWEIGKKNYSIYEALGNKYKSVKLILNKTISIYDILPNIDLVIVKTSTVGLEAMLLNKRVIVLKDSMYPYYDQLGKFANDDISSVVKQINQLFIDTKLQQEFEETRNQFLTNSYPQKLSGIRLIELIRKLTNG